MKLPSVGVVVPNFNGARFLAECLESILAQDVPPGRCLLMDGASSDESVAIARRYGDRVEIVSEKDEGQADAIDKGFRRLDTDLVGWLNSDDALMPGAISAVQRAAARSPSAVLIHGDVERIDADGRTVGRTESRDTSYEIHRRGRGRTVQPGSFYRRWAVDAAGGVDRSFHLLMDVDLWIRLLAHGPAVRLNQDLAQFRVHEAAKSSADSVYRYYRETMRLGLRHERDHLARALVRRGLYIARTHVTMHGRMVVERARKRLTARSER